MADLGIYLPEQIVDNCEIFTVGVFHVIHELRNAKQFLSAAAYPISHVNAPHADLMELTPKQNPNLRSSGQKGLPAATYMTTSISKMGQR